MADVDDRWTRDARDPGTGQVLIGDDGRPIRERTARYGKGLRYTARWRDDQRRQRTRSFSTIRDARAWLAQVDVDLRRGEYVDPKAGTITLNEWSVVWLGQQVTNESSQHQVALRVRVHILPELGGRQLKAITPSMVKSWVAGLRGTIADNYVRAVYATLSAMLQAAVEDGRIARNPCSASTVRPPAKQTRKVVPWSAQRVEAVRVALPARYRETASCAGGLGLRQGEVFGLAVDAVDWLRREVHVRQQVKLLRGRLFLDLPKGGKERTVPLPSSMSLRLAAHLEQHPAVDVTLPWGSPTGRPRTARLMFTTPEGGALHRQTFADYSWHPALTAAGVPVLRENGMHALRHYFASAVLDGGASVRDLAAWLGHTDPGFTLRTYAHLMPSSSDRMRTAIDAVFAPSVANRQAKGM